ncbi:MAG: hypothetical protein M0P71_04570 [Melioribacteraceae bacterium]|nr:hypothetical protein [Melioribacteraceae bacterium]
MNKKITFTTLILVSMTIRFSTNFGAEFIPGTNGAFYLLQVRSILKSGFILLDDFPLVFYLQALFALAVKLLTGYYFNLYLLK